MKIEILGTGCPKCDKTKKVVEEAVKQLGIDAEIVKVTQIADIMRYGVMTTPAVAVNGEVKVAGKVPSVNDIKKWVGEKV